MNETSVERSPDLTSHPLSLAAWLRTKVTNDPRAFQAIAGEECEGRIVHAYRELLAGYEVDPSTILTTTRPCNRDHRGTVTIRDINFYSLCAHHFLPFYGKIDIDYLPGEKIIGLGKFVRLVDAYARRFQIQEELVKDIATELMDSGGVLAVRIKSQGHHMCMCSRGPSDHTVGVTTTYACGDVQLLDHYLEGDPRG